MHSTSNLKNRKNSRLKNRRAVTDIISTMMLMAVTVSGASTLTYFVNDAFVSGNLGTVSTLDSSSLNVLLLAYDTRDSSSLLQLLDVDNENTINRFLCGQTCSTTTNAIPENGGTEFIVLQIQNNALNSVFLETVTINNVAHSWDSTTAGIPLDASVNDLSSTDRSYPGDGLFSILDVVDSAPVQNSSIEIPNGESVNLLIKLGPDDSDIELFTGIHVLLNTGGMHPVDFLIESGDAR